MQLHIFVWESEDEVAYPPNGIRVAVVQDRFELYSELEYFFTEVLEADDDEWEEILITDDESMFEALNKYIPRKWCIYSVADGYLSPESP